MASRFLFSSVLRVVRPATLVTRTPAGARPRRVFAGLLSLAQSASLQRASPDLGTSRSRSPTEDRSESTRRGRAPIADQLDKVATRPDARRGGDGIPTLLRIQSQSARFVRAAPSGARRGSGVRRWRRGRFGLRCSARGGSAPPAPPRAGCFAGRSSKLVEELGARAASPRLRASTPAANRRFSSAKVPGLRGPASFAAEAVLPNDRRRRGFWLCCCRRDFGRHARWARFDGFETAPASSSSGRR